MKLNKKSFNRHWLILLTVFIFVIIPFLLLFLLIGEIDLLNLDWFCGQGEIIWSGVVTNSNIDYLIDKYHPDANLYDYIGKDINLFSDNIIFNLNFLYWSIGCVVLAIVYPLIFKWLGWLEINSMSFSISCMFAMITLIYTGLIPSFGSDLATLRWIIRFLLVIFAAFIGFFITNYFVNILLSKETSDPLLISQWKKENEELTKIKKEIKKDLKNIDNNNETSVEVIIKKKVKK